MRNTHSVLIPRHMSQAMLVLLLLGLTVLASACGGNTQIQQQASQDKTQLDQLTQHAEAIGVPTTLLNPILKQEQQLSSTGAPFSPFNDQPGSNYYTNQANQYAKLEGQAQQLITTTTDQYQLQAQNDMQVFQQALTRRSSQHIGNVQPFSDTYNNDQMMLSSAKYPKDFAVVSREAQKAIDALGLMGSTFSQLTTFNNTIKQMKQAHIDVTAMATQYQNDMQDYNNATKSSEFHKLDTMIDAQYQLAVVNSIEALPYISGAKLSEFKSQVTLLKTYGMDASAYQKLYNADQTQMNKARTIQDFLAFSARIDTDMVSMHNNLVQGASTYLIGALDREANAWGQAHLYHNKTDGRNYILDAGYTLNGIGYWLNRELGWTYTPQDFQSVVDEENDQFFNLHMLEADYSDKTPYNQPHTTDFLMMKHYNVSGQIIVVSMVEQAMRVYQNGKLVKAFYVTTGRVERPSLPGHWTVQDRKSPTEFKSSDPPGSPYYYPPTPIQYGILYHWGGFFFHDAWWRQTFGAGTQFPHTDAGGTDFSNFNGSHGCINKRTADAAWLYANTDWNTQILNY
ncbi:MAG: L,D-transpeptidase [Chloroflexota bacterium]|nr:L,D-transpeptidase [Chloroflexota bacterium]